MNKQIQLLFLFLAFFNVNTIKDQDAKLDSLENLLKNRVTDDTVRVNLLNKIASAVFSKDVEKARSCATQAGELSDQLKFQKGKAESFWVLGLSHNKTDKAKAIEYFQEAIKIAKEIYEQTSVAKYLTSLGNNYIIQNQDSMAIRCFLEAIKI